jgi:hypothetical protein
MLLRIDQLAVAFYLKDTVTAFDQFDIRVRILFLQFRLHTGGLRKKVSNAAIFNKNVHNASLAVDIVPLSPLAFLLW